MIPYPWDVHGRIHGLDVSAVQPRLPYPALLAAGVSFVIAKASEGEWDDHAFATHIADAQAADLATGSYHFFRSSDDPLAQMDVYARRLDGRNLTMRPVIDWEDTTRMQTVGLGKALDAVGLSAHQIQVLTGRKPTIYTGVGVVSLFHAPQYADALRALADVADLWVAHYRWDAAGHDLGLEAPRIPAPWTEARLWQCGGNGAPRIPGVPLDIDRDVFFGSRADFDRWCDPSRAPTDPAPPEPTHFADHALQLDAQKRAPDGSEGDG